MSTRHPAVSAEILTAFRRVFLVAAATFAVVGVLDLWHVHSLRAWPAVPGDVIASAPAFETHVHAGGDVLSFTKDWGPAVLVRFVVDGRPWESRGNIAMGLAARTRTDPKLVAVLQRFPVGRRVTVHYSTAFPGDTWVETPTPNLGLWGFVLLFGAGAYFFWRLRPEDDEALRGSPTDR